MELGNLKILDTLSGSIFTGKEQNVRYKLLSICWTEPAEESICVVERDNRTIIGSTVKLTMTVSEFLKSVEKHEY